jgi:hypothetical protein
MTDGENMLERPTSIRVGYRDYRVLQWQSLEAQASRRLGESDHLALLIRLHEGLQPTVAAEVLLHEVLHCCWYIGDLRDADDEERTVSVMANQMTQVWRDNPDFVAFMSQALRTASIPNEEGEGK